MDTPINRRVGFQDVYMLSDVELKFVIQMALTVIHRHVI